MPDHAKQMCFLKVLHLCSEWNALTLIDEAAARPCRLSVAVATSNENPKCAFCRISFGAQDIFLEARSSSELQRNALVCVMLRLLEYHQG